MWVGLLPSDTGEDLVKRVIGRRRRPHRVLRRQAAHRAQRRRARRVLHRARGGTAQVRFDVTVPADRFFVMGDNRADSSDSRFHLDVEQGPVPRANIVGRAAVVCWPELARSPPAAFARIPADPPPRRRPHRDPAATRLRGGLDGRPGSDGTCTTARRRRSRAATRRHQLAGLRPRAVERPRGPARRRRTAAAVPHGRPDHGTDRRVVGAAGRRRGVGGVLRRHRGAGDRRGDRFRARRRSDRGRTAGEPWRRDSTYLRRGAGPAARVRRGRPDRRAGAGPDHAGRTPEELQEYVGHRWWNVADLVAAGGTQRFFPGRLPELIEDFLAGHGIDEPFDLWN